MTPAPPEVAEAADLDALRALAPALCGTDAGDLFASHAWFATLQAHGVPADARIRCPVAQDRASGAALALPMMEVHGLAALEAHGLAGLANYYSGLYAPLTNRPDLAPGLLAALLPGLRRRRPRPPTLRFAPLDAEGWFARALAPALARAGYVTATYFCFGNWYLPVAGRSYAQYLAGLPAALRNTLARRERRLAREGDWSVALATSDPQALEAAIADYEAVYARSWKAAEPYPQFIPALCRMAAGRGWLRLGVLRLDGRPIAAQLWLHHAGKSMIYKLAYDKDHARLSPGTILTAAMMRHALDVDRAAEIDYLSGDDPYKRAWMSHRRERIGVLGFDPASARGLAAAARHLLGRARRALAALAARARRDPAAAGGDVG